MRTVTYNSEQLLALFERQHVVTMPEMMDALGTAIKVTVHRKLATLPYRSSYSHGGSYYTLDTLADYDAQGLWAFEDRIRFSNHGTLIDTVAVLAEGSAGGYLAEELDPVVHVATRDALAAAYHRDLLHREQVGRAWLYLSCRKTRQEEQMRHRRRQESLAAYGVSYAPVPMDSVEFRESLLLFLETLDEKQRRWYLAVESMKIGRGGDQALSRLTGVNVKTIAEGRRELREKDITPGRVRRAGAGRHPVEAEKRGQ